MNTSRAIHEIQSDCYKLTRKIEAAADAQEWASIAVLAAQLDIIANRGRYHASKAKLPQINQLAMKHHRPEHEAR